MYKKILLKITLLLSNASMFATSAKRTLACAAHGATCALRTFGSIQKARYITLLEAIRNQEVEVAQALLKQNHNLIHANFDGHSLAYTAISTDNTTLIALVHEHGARLFQEELEECQSWQKKYPGLFYTPTFVKVSEYFVFDPNFATYE